MLFPGNEMAAHLSCLFITLAFTAQATENQKNILVNGNFEQGLAGWSELWTRTPGGKFALDARERHGGTQAARIEYTGQQDWCLAQQRAIAVEPGEIYELSGWIRLQGRGDATLCVTLRAADDRVVDWSFAGKTTRATADWQQLRARFVVPPGAKTMLPRLIGNGPSTVWFDDAELVPAGNVNRLRRQNLPATLKADNRFLIASLHTADGTLSVTDLRCGRQWRQWPRGPSVVLDAKRVESGFTLALLDPATMVRVNVDIRLDTNRPEMVVDLSATGVMSGALDYPHPFATDGKTFLILPINEGISYPADDQGIEPTYHYFYGGHGLCMGWFGQTDLRQAVMTIVETPDDAGVRMVRRDDLPLACTRVGTARGQVRLRPADPLGVFR